MLRIALGRYWYPSFVTRLRPGVPLSLCYIGIPPHRFRQFIHVEPNADREPGNGNRIMAALPRSNAVVINLDVDGKAVGADNVTSKRLG